MGTTFGRFKHCKNRVGNNNYTSSIFNVGEQRTATSSLAMAPSGAFINICTEQ
jgi:hypothetical protein